MAFRWNQHKNITHVHTAQISETMKDIHLLTMHVLQ